jgi:hypothetical protein
MHPVHVAIDFSFIPSLFTFRPVETVPVYQKQNGSPVNLIFYPSHSTKAAETAKDLFFLIIDSRL